jgi:hypothetical protein
MTIDSMEFATWCFDNGVRVAWILPVAAAHDGERATEILNEIIEDADTDGLAKIFGDDVRPYLDNADTSSRDDMLEYFSSARITGFLVRVERQVRKYDTKCKGMYSSGWGYFSLETWITDTIGPEFIEKVRKWSDRLLAKEKANRRKIVVKMCRSGGTERTGGGDGEAQRDTDRRDD